MIRSILDAMNENEDKQVIQVSYKDLLYIYLLIYTNVQEFYIFNIKIN